MASVLVVDDSVLMLDITRDALEAAGFEVATASSLGELELQDPMRFDLILLDVQMPELFGDDAGAVLRHGRKTNARIVLFSNLHHDELAARAREAKLDGFICKGDGIPAFVSRVKELLD